MSKYLSVQSNWNQPTYKPIFQKENSFYFVACFVFVLGVLGVFVVVIAIYFYFYFFQFSYLVSNKHKVWLATTMCTIINNLHIFTSLHRTHNKQKPRSSTNRTRTRNTTCVYALLAAVSILGTAIHCFLSPQSGYWYCSFLIIIYIRCDVHYYYVFPLCFCFFWWEKILYL